MESKRNDLLNWILVCWAAALFLTAPVAAQTQDVPAAARAEQDRQVIELLDNLARNILTLPADALLDDALRVQAEALIRDQQALWQQVWPRWVAEERAVDPAQHLPPGELGIRVSNRFFNEVALWGIELAMGPDKALWQHAVTAPRACSRLSPGPLVRLLNVVQSSPKESRDAQMRALRSVLQRWGTTRESLPHRPPSDDMDAADQAVARLRADLPVNALPMPPFLSQRVFVSRKAREPDRWEQCATAQWWLSSQLALAGADPERALAVFAYATLPELGMMAWAQEPVRKSEPVAPDQGPEYPWLARLLQVRGEVTVQTTTDGQGRLLSAKVVHRSLSVAGVRGNPPVAFEGLLDAASLDYAKRRSYPADGKTDVRTVLNWKLD